MVPFESPSTHFKALVGSVEAYAKTKLELVKLQTIEVSTRVVTEVVVRLIVYATVLLLILFLNFSIAFYLGDLFGKMYLGFACISGFYLIAAITLHFFLLKWIKVPLSGMIITHLLGTDDESL
ncbi:MAG: hypothetical protein WEC59_13065 [Salibacteraceae bacterium]